MAGKDFLFGVDHPLYCVLHWKDDVFLVAGGGGKAKTGIKNGVGLYCLFPSYDRSYSHTSLSQHDTETHLFMQCSTSSLDPNLIAASVDSECRIYAIRETEMSTTTTRDQQRLKGVEGGTPKDKQNDVTDKDSVSLKKEEEEEEEEEEEVDCLEDSFVNQFELVETAVVTTDMSGKLPSQNVVRFSFDGRHVLTGGEDGCVRVWKLPDLVAVCTKVQHTGGITDIATHPYKELSVSISRDGTAKVWECLNDIKEQNEFTAAKQYRFRACGFSNYGDKSYFFAISIPVKWSNKVRQYCYLSKWDADKWVELNSITTGTFMLTSMALHKQYIGIGDTTGGVAVYTTNLKVLMKVAAVHSSSVTDLCFIPSTVTCGDSEKTRTLLLSVSVDRSCCVNEVKPMGNKLLKCAIVITLLVILVAIISEYIWSL